MWRINLQLHKLLKHNNNHLTINIASLYTTVDGKEIFVEEEERIRQEEDADEEGVG
jgi:hypothetical protein